MALISALGGLPSMSALDGLNGLTGATPTGASKTTGVGGAGGTSSSGSGSFTDAIGDALSRLNTQLSGADASMQAFASGQSADIGSVMLEMQQASLDLKLGTQVRDRLLDAYNTVMRLQL